MHDTHCAALAGDRCDCPRGEDLAIRAREIAPGLSHRMCEILACCCASEPFYPGAEHVHLTVDALMRRGLVIRRGHSAQATDLGRAVAAELAEGGAK